MDENILFFTNKNAEYIHLIQDPNVWFIDYMLGVAFRTPIHFGDKMNGLCESGRPYKEFSDYKDMQDYLEEIIGQEIVIESAIEPETHTEYDTRIVWQVKPKLESEATR
jgi:hypothetical protein